MLLLKAGAGGEEVLMLNDWRKLQDGRKLVTTLVVGESAGVYCQPATSLLICMVPSWGVLVSGRSSVIKRPYSDHTRGTHALFVTLKVDTLHYRFSGEPNIDQRHRGGWDRVEPTTGPLCSAIS